MLQITLHLICLLADCQCLWFAGDWLKYDLIDEQTQNSLTAAARVGLVGHTAIAVIAARDVLQTSSQESRDQSATALLTTGAAARGFFLGFLELVRVLAVQTVRDAKSSQI